MRRKHADSLDQNERREDALRPCPYLGYDRDELGMYILSCGALRVAETQFRRAVWLNPYEPRFKIHLAWCLFRQGAGDKALEHLKDVESNIQDEDLKSIAALIRNNTKDKKEP